MYLNKEEQKREELTPRQMLACLLLVMILLSLFGSRTGVLSEELGNLTETGTIVEMETSLPIITSVGKKNIKVGGVISKGTLIRYTIPEALLRADPAFLKLMTEAEKYIGYPYVYGGSKPSVGFDCAGFVCHVFRSSGLYKLKNCGANGLHKLCREVAAKEARPGDLVFFEKTMGRNVKGITHVGIYVGNGMMLHAGDPVGFADIRSEQWSQKIVCYGRLPLEQ